MHHAGAPDLHSEVDYGYNAAATQSHACSVADVRTMHAASKEDVWGQSCLRMR
jgi:hypothetical protein